MDALELALEAKVAAGGHREAAAELDALAAEHPLREHLHALRVPPYRCGRQAEALAAYRERATGWSRRSASSPAPSSDACTKRCCARTRRSSSSAAPAPARARRRRRPAATRPRDRAPAVARAVVTSTSWTGDDRRAARTTRLGAHPPRGRACERGPPGRRAVLDEVPAAGHVERPTLLVLDEIAQAPVLEGPVLTIATAVAIDAGFDATVALTGLDAPAVRAIAQLYAPGEEQIPTEALLQASGGLPGRAHAVAIEWAQGVAAQRVDAIAGRTAASRAELRVVVSEFADSVAGLQVVRELAVVEPQEAAVVCPFKGLASFDVVDAPYFHGRERLVAELVTRLVGTSLLLVIGPSGSGKSSVMRAGLLPALASGVLPGSADWPQSVIRPGETSVAELAKDGVLVVDQFEEVFCDGPRRGGARRVRRGAAGTLGGRRPGAARRLLRAPSPRTPSWSQPRHRRTTCSSARFAPAGAARDRAARAARRSARRARTRRSARTATSRISPERSRCSPPRCSSSGRPATERDLRLSAYARQRRRSRRGRAAGRSGVRAARRPSAGHRP